MINQMSCEIGDQLGSVSDFLPTFTKGSSPFTVQWSRMMYIQYCNVTPDLEQALSHEVAGLQNLTTVSTFFSSVTASMLQFSFQLQDGGIANAVNTLWLISLVLSVSAAVSGLVAITWKQSL